jgi:hypothetical protein
MNKLLEEFPAMIVALGALALAGLMLLNKTDTGLVMAVAEFPLIYYFQRSAFAWSPQQSPPLILSSPPLQTERATAQNTNVPVPPG